jgi:ATP-dependent protease ClpP protease subunit
VIQYIVFMADVQAAQIGKLREAITNAMNAGNDIHLIMSSPGGNVAEGLNMAAFMKSLPVKITTHNFLQTDSIANVIFASGSVRYASPNSSFMFHGVTFHYEKQDLTENQIGEQHTGIRMLREKIAAAFAAYTGMTTTEVNSRPHLDVTRSSCRRMVRSDHFGSMRNWWAIQSPCLALSKFKTFGTPQQRLMNCRS